MKKEEIIYNTARELINVEDKINLATIFIFFDKIGAKEYAELLYTNNPQKTISQINKRYLSYDIYLGHKFSDKNFKNAFEKTRQKLIETDDKQGFYKAIYNQDSFALQIINIISKVEKFDKIKFIRDISRQLKLF